MAKHLTYVWDYDLDEDEFKSLLDGRITLGPLDRDWAAIRLLDYAPYAEIRRLLGWGDLVRGWPLWRKRVRSETRRRGFDFLVAWLPQARPDLL